MFNYFEFPEKKWTQAILFIKIYKKKCKVLPTLISPRRTRFSPRFFPTVAATFFRDRDDGSFGAGGVSPFDDDSKESRTSRRRRWRSVRGHQGLQTQPLWRSSQGRGRTQSVASRHLRHKFEFQQPRCALWFFTPDFYYELKDRTFFLGFNVIFLGKL